MAVIESKGNGFSLFNCVKLPSLPELDKETYPCVFVSVSTGGKYRCVVATHPFNLNDTGKPVASANLVRMSVSLSAEGVWGSWSTPSEAQEGTIMNVGNPIWSNYDILNADGTTYLTASEPISLDGMNVIEWDGDTTGLEVSPTASGYYRVSNATDTDTSKTVISVKQYVGGGAAPLVGQVWAEKTGYFQITRMMHYIPAITDTLTSTGFFAYNNSSYYSSLFAYYPIETGGGMSAGKKFLLRKLFPPVIANALIRKDG